MPDVALARLKLLKSDMFLDQGVDTWDNEYKAALIVATQIAENYIGRTMTKTTYADERYSGQGRYKELWLRNHPVSSVTTVKIWDNDDTYDTEDAAYYELIDEAYIYFPKLGQESDATFGCWPEGTNNIKITYVAGYDCTNWATAAYPEPGGSLVFAAPRDLEYAVAKIAALIVLESKGDIGDSKIGVLAKSLGGASISVEQYEKGIPPDCRRILNSYRRLPI